MWREITLNKYGDLISKTLFLFWKKGNGGVIVANPRVGKTDIVIAPNPESFHVKILIQKGYFDILTVDWLVDCLEQNQLVEKSNSYFVFATENSRF